VVGRVLPAAARSARSSDSAGSGCSARRCGRTAGEPDQRLCPGAAGGQRVGALRFARCSGGPCWPGSTCSGGSCWRRRCSTPRCGSRASARTSKTAHRLRSRPRLWFRGRMRRYGRIIRAALCRTGRRRPLAARTAPPTRPWPVVEHERQLRRGGPEPVYVLRVACHDWTRDAGDSWGRLPVYARCVHDVLSRSLGPRPRPQPRPPRGLETGHLTGDCSHLGRKHARGPLEGSSREQPGARRTEHQPQRYAERRQQDPDHLASSRPALARR
jgi:hypothetical protein